MQENEIQVRVQQEVQRLLTTDPQQAIMIAARAIEAANEQRQQAVDRASALQSHVATELMPKVEMWEVAMGTDQLFEMSAVAKILNYRNMGRNNIFEYLKDKKILRYNKEPYQQYVDSGYFKIVEQSFDAGNGIKIYRKTMATQKGIGYIGKLLKGDDYAPNAR